VQGNAPKQDWKQPLVWLVAAILAVGVVVGTLVADARSPSYALGSELVYRLEIGAVTVGAMLFVLTTLRLASFGRTFTSFGAGSVRPRRNERVDALERRPPSADAPQ
jgi:hypothetical protein